MIYQTCVNINLLFNIFHLFPIILPFCFVNNLHSTHVIVRIFPKYLIDISNHPYQMSTSSRTRQGGLLIYSRFLINHPRKSTTHRTFRTSANNIPSLPIKFLQLQLNTNHITYTSLTTLSTCDNIL